MKYYLRKRDSKVVDGPLAPHDIQSLIPSKIDLENTLAVAARGQSMGTLLRRSEWEPLASVLKREGIARSELIDDPLKTEKLTPPIADREFICQSANFCVGLVIACGIFLIMTAMESPAKDSPIQFFLIGTCATVVCFFILGVKHIVLLLAKIAADRVPDPKQQDQEI